MKRLKEHFKKISLSPSSASGTSGASDTSGPSGASNTHGTCAANLVTHDQPGPKLVLDDHRKIGSMILREPSLPQHNNTTFDVVFVHGLRGSILGTWTDRSGRVCWPRDLLGDDLPEARIIAWGYDSSITKLFSHSSQESLFGHGETLLDDIARIRHNISRPIVFVCHSLGGLVVKQALIKASSYHQYKRHEDLGAIYSATVGVVFMGTPHRGSDQVSYAELIAKVAGATLHQPNNKLISVLPADSDVLEDQRDNWTSISQAMKIICVREELPTGIGLIVPDHSASYDGFNVSRKAINSNHSEMVKFYSRKDIGYERTLGWIREVSKASSQREMKRIEQTKDRILEALSFPAMQAWESNIDEVEESTCIWLMDQRGSHGEVAAASLPKPGFMEWLADPSKNGFWISGKAGSGKSTLMRYIHDHCDVSNELQHWRNGLPIIKMSFFFSQSTFGTLHSSREGMLRSLLFQLLQSKREMIPSAFPTLFTSTSEISSEYLTKWNNLQSAFENLIKTAEDCRFFLLVDGLDEFRLYERRHEYTEDQRELLHDGENEDEAWGINDWISDGHREIATWITRCASFGNLKICFSCRELNVFEDRFAKLPRLQVHLHTLPAIRGYCDQTLLRDASVLDTETRDLISERITERSHGVFLWVKLVTQKISFGAINGDTRDELWEKILEMPSRMSGRKGLYMHLLQSIEASHRPEAFRLFKLQQLFPKWTNLMELFFADNAITQDPNTRIAAIQNEPLLPRKWRLLRPRWEQMARRLKSRTGGLLEVIHADEDDQWAYDPAKVEFIHLTARQFVHREYASHLLASESSRPNQASSIGQELQRTDGDHTSTLACILLAIIRRAKSNWTMLWYMDIARNGSGWGSRCAGLNTWLGRVRYCVQGVERGCLSGHFNFNLYKRILEEVETFLHELWTVTADGSPGALSRPFWEFFGTEKTEHRQISPSFATLGFLNAALEFEWFLCIASRLQTRSAKAEGVQELLDWMSYATAYHFREAIPEKRQQLLSSIFPQGSGGMMESDASVDFQAIISWVCFISHASSSPLPDPGSLTTFFQSPSGLPSSGLSTGTSVMAKGKLPDSDNPVRKALDEGDYDFIREFLAIGPVEERETMELIPTLDGFRVRKLYPSKPPVEYRAVRIK